MNSAGAFASGTGDVTRNGDLHGDNTIASGKDSHMMGAGTFASGTGAPTLNCESTIAIHTDFRRHRLWQHRHFNDIL